MTKRGIPVVMLAWGALISEASDQNFAVIRFSFLNFIKSINMLIYFPTVFLYANTRRNIKYDLNLCIVIRHIWWEWKVYCSVILARSIESVTFINFFIKQIKPASIFKATEARLPPNANSARPHHKHHHCLVYISCYQSCNRQNLISVVSASH
jgi:hypothetical protein